MTESIADLADLATYHLIYQFVLICINDTDDTKNICSDT